MAFIIGFMLILVAAGCVYAVRQASHYSRDNTLVNTPITEPVGQSDSSGGTTAR